MNIKKIYVHCMLLWQNLICQLGKVVVYPTSGAQAFLRIKGICNDIGNTKFSEEGIALSSKENRRDGNNISKKGEIECANYTEP